jgi:hypothetical protein
MGPNGAGKVHLLPSLQERNLLKWPKRNIFRRRRLRELARRKSAHKVFSFVSISSGNSRSFSD